MSPPEARLRLRENLRRAALDALEAGIAASDGGRAVMSALPALLERPPLAEAPRVDVLAWGKAAVSMAMPALRLLGERCAVRLIVTKDGHAEAPGGLGSSSILLAGHPVPDARSLRAAEAALELAVGGDPATPLLMLGSGGGSSLLACPPEGVSLDDLVTLSGLLLRSGAGIREMNVVRRHVSRIHGGRLARALGARASLSLLLSDVPGNDPSDIGSGPLAPDDSTFADAVDVVTRRIGWESAPEGIRRFLEQGERGDVPETPGRDALDWSRHAAVIVASNEEALRHAADALRARGFVVPAASLPSSGRSAEEVAGDLVAGALRRRLRGDERGAILGGGEPSVVVIGSAPGGRNEHLAAAAARELDRAATRGLLAGAEIVIASLATDGQDGEGAIAGAVVDASTWSRAVDAGLDPEALLRQCRAREILAAAGALVPGGPTGTNVMDLHVAMMASVPESVDEARA